MDGKEVPVLSNYHELMLINTNKGSEILLEYSILPAEKKIAMLSIAGFLGFCIFVLLLIKLPDEDSQE